MKRILLILTMAINAFFCVMVHGQTVPTEQPQRVQHPYYQYDGFIEAKKGILLPRRIANFTPKSPVLIYDTVSGKVSVYFGGWKSLQNVAYTSDYNDLINRPDLTQYVPTSRTINGYSLTSNITINKVDIGLGNVQNVDVTNAGNITSGTLSDARLSANVTLQGNTFNGANQLLQLDAGGKVAYANLPASLMIYKGVWDASTNTPTLADGSGVNGWVYRVHPGGTVNFGSGNITFLSGDYVIYNGSVWQKSGGGDAVTSVNGQQGVVVLTTANIAEGGTNYYYTNTRVQTFGDTRYSLLNHEHVYSDIANLSSYTGFDVRYKSISYVPAWSDITGKPSFATVATSGSYTDLSGTPTLGSVAALSSIGNTYITDVAWSKLTGVPSSFTPSAHTHPYSDLTGTVPTWNQNTTGNAATATTATTATNWGVVPNSLNSPAEASGLTNLIGVHSNTYAYKFTSGAVQSWLGLGSNAYTSTAFLPLTGGTLSGTIAAPTGKFGNAGNNAVLEVATAIGEVFRADASGGALRIVVNQTGLITQGTFAHTGTFTGINNSANQAIFYGWNNTDGSSDNAGEIRIASNSAYQGRIIYSPAGNTNLFIDNSFNDNGAAISFRLKTASTAVTQLSLTATSATFNTLTGSGNRLVLANSSGVLGSAVIGSGLSFDGTTLTATGGSSGTVTGSGTSGYVPLWNSTSDIGNSIIQANSTYVAIGGSAGTYKFRVYGNVYFDNELYTSGVWASGYGPSGSGTAINFKNWSNTTIGSINTTNGDASFDGTVTASSFSGTATGLIGTASGLSIGGSAGSVAWTNVTSRPTAVSSFTNDAGYITSAVTSIAGTSNQIAVSAATGSVTVSLTNNVVIPGTITSSASYESSDRRLKRALSGTRLIGQIESLQARLYEKDGRDEYGYYAQDALKIIPTAVKQRADGYYDLSYTQVFVVKIASLEKRVSELEILLQKINGK